MQTPETEPASELASRLLFSFFRSGARLAAKFQIPIDRFNELAQLAYFQELRRRHPRDLATVADILGVSLRTAGTLNKRLKTDFFRAEHEVETLRAVTDLLLEKDSTLEPMAEELNLEVGEVKQALRRLQALDWVAADNHVYRLTGSHRSFITEDLERRVDGLNHQLDIIVDSVKERFLHGNETTARSRSWSFAARDEEVAGFIDDTVRSLRHGAIELEESALQHHDYRRYGVTLSINPLEEE